MELGPVLYRANRCAELGASNITSVHGFAIRSLSWAVFLTRYQTVKTELLLHSLSCRSPPQRPPACSLFCTLPEIVYTHESKLAAPTSFYVWFVLYLVLLVYNDWCILKTITYWHLWSCPWLLKGTYMFYFQPTHHRESSCFHLDHRKIFKGSKACFWTMASVAWGAWVAQPVEHLTLDFSSSHDLRVMRSSASPPNQSLHLTGSLLKILSLSLSPCSLSLSLSKINK